MADRTIHFVSLGCPKNRVDSEVMLGVAQRAGFQHVADPQGAEVIVVNTCGFIEEARQESIDTILQLAQYKGKGRCEQLVVTGCLSQRYPEQLAEGMPEVDHFLGSSDMLKLELVLAGGADRVMVGNPANWVIRATDPRTLSMRGASAYVKLAEGCNRTCGFCVIPKLRGRQRSRSADDIVQEVTQLAGSGILEINLVSQDTVAYGRDVKEANATLADVVERVADVAGIRWVRLHYLYPEKLDPRLIELLAQHPRVLPYVDMPLQHAAESMLRRMRRGHGGATLRQLVEQLRTTVPNLVFRSAFIVGHPGETEQEFEELLQFIRWAQLDRVGVFRYSDETETTSHELGSKVPARVANARARKLIGAQRTISKRKNKALIGQDVEVLVEGPSEESEWVMVGRHAGQAPSVDGCVFISGGPVLPGTIHIARVTQAADYDLVVEVENDEHPAVPSSCHPPPVELKSGRVSLRTVT